MQIAVLRGATAASTNAVSTVRRLIKPTAAKSYDRQLAALRTSTALSAARFNTASLTLGAASTGWLEIGSFKDTFVGTINVIFDNPTVTYSDSLRIDITYHRTGDQIAVSAARGGNASSMVSNPFNTKGLSALCVTNVALSAANTQHTVAVYYGWSAPDFGTFTVYTDVKCGNFTLGSPMVYGATTFASADAGYMDCSEGHNASSMALHGATTIENAVIDRCAVGQLTGSVQSLLNVPANTPLIQLGNLQAQFQGTIRIETSTTTTVPAATHAVTLQID
eukprot:11550-Heterococcus_DN1.PRE.1